MRNLKPVLLKKTDVFDAWITLLGHCIANEYEEFKEIIFGDKDEPKTIAAEVMSIVVLDEHAVNQLIDWPRLIKKEGFPYGENFIRKYIEEYTYEFIEEQKKLPEEEQFVYNYFGLLTDYDGFNQVEALKENIASQLKEKIFSNRHQMITWMPKVHAFSQSPPCLQRVWVTLVTENTIDVHLDWRSRDLYGAWLPNLIALISMINREIAFSNNCKIVRLIDRCDSCHIYKGDMESAKKITKRL